MLQRSLLVGAALAAAVSSQGDPTSKSPRPPVVTPDLKVAPEAAAKVQDPQQGATPAPVVRPDRPRPAAKGENADLVRTVAQAFEQPDFVLFDQPTAGGPLFCVGRDYKASFAADGWQFVAMPATPAAPSLPLHFRTTSWSLGGRTTAVGDVAPTRAGNRVEYRHDGFVEAIDARNGEVEQTWRFDTLSSRGELTLTIAVATARTGVDRGDGVTFDSETGNVAYSEAVAIDATGARIAAPTEFANGQITIRVPAAFVESARLPLVVDPTVANTTVYTHNTQNVSNPDLVWDNEVQNWLVTFERHFSADDVDVYVQRLDAAMVAVGTIAVVDNSFDLWALPKIANLNLYDKNLVVAQVSADAPAPYWIAGRMLDGTGTMLTGQFDIERAGVAGHLSGEKLNPDVGGDPHIAGPTYFTVVWERVIDATDHDIHMKQVDQNGNLRNASPTLIDNSSGFESNPSISKGDGKGFAAQQRFVVVYQRTWTATDEDIRAALLTWDGQFVQVAGANTFVVSGSTANDIRPQVSSPTDGEANGTRHVMVVYERTTANGGDIAGAVMTTNGNVLTVPNLTMMENDPRLPWPQSRPSVDCDGTRFAVAYQEVFTGSGNDLDARISLFGFDTNTNTVVLHENAVGLATSTAAEFNTAIAAKFSSTGVRSPRYGTAHERSTSAPFLIEAGSYDGFAPGGFTTRATQCGTPLAITATGTPVIGMTVDFTIATAFPLAGFVFGAPTSVGIPTCGCTLGVDGTLLVGNSLQIAIPSQVNLVGLTFATQGFTFAGGPCLGSVSVTDTIDFVVQ